MTTLWKQATGPSAGLVQRHFVEARQNDLKRRNPELEKKVAKVLMEHSSLKHLKLKGDRWLEVYRKINKNLQDAELTINFTGESWFSTENLYLSYTQMYERSVGADGKLLLKSDKLNPADVRARVDDAVTFPKTWSDPAGALKRGLSLAYRADNGSGRRCSSARRSDMNSGPPHRAPASSTTARIRPN